MSESYTKVERKIRKPKSKKYEILRMKNNSVSEKKTSQKDHFITFLSCLYICQINQIITALRITT